MAENNPSKLPAEEVKRIFDEIAVLKAEKKSLRESNNKEGVKGKNEQINALYAQLGNHRNRRGKSADSRATGTTVGTTESREMAHEHIQRWEETVKSLSEEIEANKKDLEAVKKLKKKISILNSKIKKKREKHNTGAATPRSIAQSLVSQLTALTAGTTTPESTKAAVPESNVGKNGLVKAIQSKTSSAIFPLLPPPIINKKITDGIRGYCSKYQELFLDTDSMTPHYSYNPCVFKTNEEDKASCECFYVKMQKTKQKNGKEMKVNHNYVAYVKNAEYLSMVMDSLQNEDIHGTVYVSVSCFYRKDDKQHVGFITFLIPFSKKKSDVTVTGNTVCAIETNIQNPGSEPSTLKEFIDAYGSYIYASNIDLDDYNREAPNLAQNTSMTGKAIKTLVMTFKDIQNHEKTLIRTWKGFKIQDQVTVWANAKVKSGDKIAWMANIKMLLPYIRQNDINVAKDIIGKAVGQCQHAVAQYHEKHPGDSQQFFEHIWYTTVWILIAEMSKEKMINQRIADLSTGIMQKFEEVYLRDTTNHPQWTKFLRHESPTTPMLDLKDILDKIPAKTSSGKPPNSASKLPDVIPYAVNSGNAGGVKVASSATQFRDW